MSDLHFDRALRGAARRGRPEGVCPDAAARASSTRRGAASRPPSTWPSRPTSRAVLRALSIWRSSRRWMRRRRPPTRRTCGRSSGSLATGAGWYRWPRRCSWSPSGCVCPDRATLRSPWRRKSTPKHPGPSQSPRRWRASEKIGDKPAELEQRADAPRDSMPSTSWKRRDETSEAVPAVRRSTFTQRSATKTRPTSGRPLQCPALALLQLPLRHRRQRQRRRSSKRRSRMPQRGPNRGRLRMPRLPRRRKTRRCSRWRRRWRCRRPRA